MARSLGREFAFFGTQQGADNARHRGSRKTVDGSARKLVVGSAQKNLGKLKTKEGIECGVV